MLNMKKVILVGATMAIAVGCSVFAASGDKFSFNDFGMRKRVFKEKFSNSIDVGSSASSGDTIKKGKGKFRKPECKNLTEEEKAELKEKFENLSEEEKTALKEKMNANKASRKEKFENLSEEEKAELKEKRESEKADRKEKLENLSEEQKEALKEKMGGKKGHKFQKKNATEAQEA